MPSGQAPQTSGGLRGQEALRVGPSPLLPRSRMISNTVAASRISRTSPSLSIAEHLCPFALWTAFPSAPAGRDSCDYYGHSVAIGLAPRRPSRIPLALDVSSVT